MGITVWHYMGWNYKYSKRLLKIIKGIDMYVLVVLVLYLVALWFQLYKEGFTPMWTSEEKKDYSGNDIGSSLTGMTLAKCKEKCIGDSTCQGLVTDFSGDGPGSCWLKNKWGTSSANDARFTYKLNRPA